MPQFSDKRRVRHAAADMFDLVADVERYPEFVPMCRELKIRRRIQEPNAEPSEPRLAFRVSTNAPARA